MKKLSEINTERRQNEVDAQERYLQACTHLLTEVESQDIPLYKDPRGTDITDYTKGRIWIRQGLMRDSNKSFHLSGIACDHCETQLLYIRPNQVTLSSPPLKSVGCPGCGCQDWVPV